MTGDEWVYGVLVLVPLVIAGASLYGAYRIERLQRFAPGQSGWLTAGRLLALFLLTGTVWIGVLLPVAVGLSLGQTDWAGIAPVPGQPDYLRYRQMQELTGMLTWTLGNLWYLPAIFVCNIVVYLLARPAAKRT